MIIAKLIGGLGNQMFQYAAGRALAHLHHTNLKLDKTLLEADPKGAYTKRNFELDIFNLKADFTNESETGIFLKHASNKIYREAYRKFPAFFKNKYIAENSKSYLPGFKNYGPNAYLDGFWQSEKYFMEAGDVIRTDFTFKSQPNQRNAEALEKIKNCNSVSIHIRRGDYISNAGANQIHGTCNSTYYEQAVQLINKNVNEAELFVFSDDIEWCKQNLSFPLPVHFINHNSGKDSFEDMRLMSACKHNVIANSSFSWWAAWLNNQSGKIVVSPKQWFKNESTPDIYPNDWIQL